MEERKAEWVPLSSFQVVLNTIIYFSVVPKIHFPSAETSIPIIGSASCDSSVLALFITFPEANNRIEPSLLPTAILPSLVVVIAENLNPLCALVNDSCLSIT